MIEVKVQVNTNLRPTPSTDNTYIKVYPAGTILKGPRIITIPADVYKGGTLIQKANDKWLEVTDPQPGFMALVHKGSSAGLPVIIKDDTGTGEEEPAGDKIIRAVFYWESGKVEELP